MPKLYLLAVLVITLTGCDTLTKKRLPGTYHFIGQKHPFQAISKFELTDTKFIMASLFGEAAMDYEVEGDYLYINSAGVKYRFYIVSLDTLRADANSPFQGTYVKAK